MLRLGRRAVRRSSEGFTLIEVLVTLVVTVVILVAILALFDFTSKLTSVQTQVADMQEELRIGQYDLVRLTRMAGRGGLPASLPGKLIPDGAAIAVINNAPTGTHIGDSTSPLVVPNTDILTVRGAITAPIYQINYTDAGFYGMLDAGGNPTIDPTLARKVVLQICAISPAGVLQDLVPIRDAITNSVNEAVELVSPLEDSIYGVVALDAANSLTTSAACGDGVTLSLNVGSRGATANPEDLYAALSPAPVGGRLPASMTKVGFVNVVEEYRFYIRQEYALPSDTTSAPTPRLSRARFFPNSNVPYRNNVQNLSLDVSENIVDLQVAIAVDTNSDDQITDTNDNADEWLYNDPADIDATPTWNTRPLYHLRLTTVARADRFDPKYSAPRLARIEDHLYPAATGENTRENRMRRRRIAQSIVTPRNTY